MKAAKQFIHFDLAIISVVLIREESVAIDCQEKTQITALLIRKAIVGELLRHYWTLDASSLSLGAVVF